MLLNTTAAVKRIYENYLSHGASDAQRVGWNSREVQLENYHIVLDALAALMQKHRGRDLDQLWRTLSVHDAGCGTGDLLDTLQVRGGVGYYLGTDFMPQTMKLARQRFPERSDVRFAVLDLLNSPKEYFPTADVTLCFGALAFHPPRKIEELLHRLWGASQVGLGFITWWNLTPDYVYFEHIEQLRKCVSRFLRESRAKEVVQRHGYGDKTEAAFCLIK